MALPICVLEMLRRGMRVDIYSYIYIYIYMHICCILRLNVANDILVQYMCIHTHIHVARVVIYICTCIYMYEYVCAVHTYIVYKYIVGDMEAHDKTYMYICMCECTYVMYQYFVCDVEARYASCYIYKWSKSRSRYLVVQSRIEILIGFEFQGILRYKFKSRFLFNFEFEVD